MIIAGGIEIKQGHYPDNTLLMKLNPNDEEFDSVFDMVDIEWYYENDAELFTLICVKRHLDKYVKDIFLHMPYIPHARMDRVKNPEDVFTLKYFCEIINSLDFKQIYVRDAHSSVSLALLNDVVDLGNSAYVTQALEECGAPALFFPDEGAMKRYSSAYNLPYAFGIKKRDWASGNILGLDIAHSENITGKDVLIVDDICSRGGTFYHSAKALKAAGANKIYLFVTHLEATVFDGDLLNSDLIEKIYTTHSIFPKEKANDKIIII